MKIPSLAARAVTAAIPFLSQLQERACLSCSSPCSSDACQVDSPGGLMLFTTFWDYNPSTGPSNRFTIHGLWPDHCDLSYDSTCDSSRAESDIGGVLQTNGAQSTLDYMNQLWVDINGDNGQFWSHEWNKHGTCVSTIRPQCYGSGYYDGKDIVDYFTVTVNLSKKYDLYAALGKAGITPTSSKTYTKTAIQNAAKAAFGYTPALKCYNGNLKGADWFHQTSGRSTTSANFVLQNPPSGQDNCPTNIKWLPKQ